MSKSLCMFAPKLDKMQTEAQKIATKKYRSSQKFKDWQREYRKTRRNDPEYLAKLKTRKQLSHSRNIVHNLWKRTKERALRKGIEFTLVEADILIPKICPILEIPIFVGTKKGYRNSPTIDRVDNLKGYTKDNCQVISMLANTMKNSASQKEIETFCRNIPYYLTRFSIPLKTDQWQK